MAQTERADAAGAEYSWRSVQSTVLRGLALRLFARFASTPLFPVVQAFLAESSGVPQVRDVNGVDSGCRTTGRALACTLLAHFKR